MRKKLVFDVHKSDRINRRNNEDAWALPKLEEEVTVIYALVDPRDGAVFYIGLTNDPYVRFKQHMLMNDGNDFKRAMIQEILHEHRLPWMLTLEVVGDFSDPRRRELYWIERYLDHGAHLLNDEVRAWRPPIGEEIARTQEGA